MQRTQQLIGRTNDPEKLGALHGTLEETSLQEKQKRAFKAKDDLRKAWAKRKAGTTSVASKDFSGFLK